MFGGDWREKEHTNTQWTLVYYLMILRGELWRESRCILVIIFSLNIQSERHSYNLQPGQLGRVKCHMAVETPVLTSC